MSTSETRIAKALREAGLTGRQVEAGLRYYRKFCRPLGIWDGKCVRMIVRMVKNMREAILSDKGLKQEVR